MPYSWWKDGTEWADVAIDSLISVVKPVFVPNAQVSALLEYYNKDLIDVYNETDLTSTEKFDLEKSIYEYYAFIDSSEVLTNPDVENFMTTMSTSQWDGYAENEKDNVDNSTFADINAFNILTGDYSTDANNLDLTDEIYKSTYAILNRIDTADIEQLAISHDDPAYGCWVSKNYTVYNYEWKIEKYNYADEATGPKIYKHYYNSFIENDSIRTPVVVLYSQFTVSLILAFYFVSKYPINMFQARLSVKKDKHGKNTLD